MMDEPLDSVDVACGTMYGLLACIVAVAIVIKLIAVALS